MKRIVGKIALIGVLSLFVGQSNAMWRSIGAKRVQSIKRSSFSLISFNRALCGRFNEKGALSKSLFSEDTSNGFRSRFLPHAAMALVGSSFLSKSAFAEETEEKDLRDKEVSHLKDLFQTELEKSRLSDVDTQKIEEIARKLIQLKVGADLKGVWGETLLHFVESPEIAADLIKLGADVNASSWVLGTPLESAVNAGRNELAQILLKEGANVNYVFSYVKSREIAQELIRFGADVNGRNSNRGTPLHAVKDQGVAQVLLQAGADVHARDGWGDTPLHCIASRAGDQAVAIMKDLIDANADIEARNIDGNTPLHVAITNSANHKGNPKVACALIKAGANVKALGGYGKTTLQATHNVEVAKALLAAGADVKQRGKDGSSSLHSVGSVEMAQLFIDKGADVNAKDDKGYTPLTFTRDPEIQKLLIKEGADVTVKQRFDRTNLLFCAGDAEVAQMLIDRGVDVNERYKYSHHTPLHVEYNPEIAKVLIKAGADINAKDRRGKTPLLFMLYDKRHFENQKVLIDMGANVNISDNRGDSPLHIAVKKGNSAILTYLIEAGATVNIKNHDGNTPLHLAVEQDNSAMVESLIKAGADIQVSNANGKTSLNIAKSADVRKILIKAVGLE